MMIKASKRTARKLLYVSLLGISIAALSACGKSTISMNEAGERLNDIGHDFVTGERTVTSNEMKREAYDIAVDYIKNNISNPSSADFSECNEDNIAESTDGTDLYYSMVIDVTAEDESGDVKTISYNVKVSGYPDYQVTEINELN